jgi:hypothetical protein
VENYGNKIQEKPGMEEDQAVSLFETYKVGPHPKARIVQTKILYHKKLE